MIDANVKGFKRFFKNQEKQGYLKVADLDIYKRTPTLSVYEEVSTAEQYYDGVDRATWVQLDSLGWKEFGAIVQYVQDNADIFDDSLYQEAMFQDNY